MNQPAEQNAAPAGQAPASGPVTPPAPPSRGEVVSGLAPLYPVAKTKPQRTGISKLLGSPIALAVVILLALAALLATTAAQHNASPIGLKVGDCFDSPVEAGSPALTSGITGVQPIDCDKPHDSQVYAEPKIPDSSFPDISVLQDQMQDACGNADTQSGISHGAPAGIATIEFSPQDAASFAAQDYFVCAIQYSSQTLTQSWVNTATMAG